MLDQGHGHLASPGRLLIGSSHQPHGSQRSIIMPQSPDLHFPQQEPMATQGESKLRCAIKCKMHIGFWRLSLKKNARYLNNFLY